LKIPSEAISYSTTLASSDWSDGHRAEFSGRIDEFGDLTPALRRQLAKSLKVMNRETQSGVFERKER
jgi:hypothetical protein